MAGPDRPAGGVLSIAIETTGDGVRIPVRAQPRASRSTIVGPHGGALRVRLAAPPVGGAANRELEKVLARALGVPKSAVTVVAGRAGRTKMVAVTGVTAAQAMEALGVGGGRSTAGGAGASGRPGAPGRPGR